MISEETYYTIALTRMTGFNLPMALNLYQTLGSGQAVYEHRTTWVMSCPTCRPVFVNPCETGTMPCTGLRQKWSSSSATASVR